MFDIMGIEDGTLKDLTNRKIEIDQTPTPTTPGARALTFWEYSRYIIHRGKGFNPFTQQAIRKERAKNKADAHLDGERPLDLSE